MHRKPPNAPPKTDEETYQSLPEDSFLDLKRLSQRTCMSVRSLRYHINDHSHPLPVYRVRGKILVNWVEFKKWIQAFRQKTEDIDKIVDEVMASKVCEGRSRGNEKKYNVSATWSNKLHLSCRKKIRLL